MTSYLPPFEKRAGLDHAILTNSVVASASHIQETLEPLGLGWSSRSRNVSSQTGYVRKTFRPQAGRQATLHRSTRRLQNHHQASRSDGVGVPTWRKDLVAGCNGKVQNLSKVLEILLVLSSTLFGSFYSV